MEQKIKKIQQPCIHYNLLRTTGCLVYISKKQNNFLRQIRNIVNSFRILDLLQADFT